MHFDGAQSVAIGLNRIHNLWMSVKKKVKLILDEWSNKMDKTKQ